MTSEPSVFDLRLPLPDPTLRAREATLLGFDVRYERVRRQLRLLLEADKLAAWNRKHHSNKLDVVALVGDQYPLIVFHGDVGTGKTVTAECMANRIVAEAKVEDAELFKLSNRVRGEGLVGQMGSKLSTAFLDIAKASGKKGRAVLIIDEGDSLGASRTQAHSHHEDKVAVNTLIQGIDDLRRHGGRIVVFLCTNRLSALDPALRRRAAVTDEFRRPTKDERRQLFDRDLAALKLSSAEVGQLVNATSARNGDPDWTFSDIRTRLYPAAMAEAYPDGPLTFEILASTATALRASPALEDVA